MSAEASFEIVVGADGGIAPEELARHGVRPGAHLRVAPEVEHPTIRPAFGLLTGHGPSPSWQDFQSASALAVADVETGPSYPDR